MNCRILTSNEATKQGISYVKIPRDIKTALNHSIGTSSTQLRVMEELIGLKPGTMITTQSMLQATGLDQFSYSKTLKALKNIGFIDYTKDTITVNYDKIREAA